jgi:hypothetical protein
MFGFNDIFQADNKKKILLSAAFSSLKHGTNNDNNKNCLTCLQSFNKKTKVFAN